MPIYQACGTEYGIPWEVLASINKIETGFGTNLNVSTAGALGWMQFLPSSWEAFGVDADGNSKKALQPEPAFEPGVVHVPGEPVRQQVDQGVRARGHRRSAARHHRPASRRNATSSIGGARVSTSAGPPPDRRGAT